MFKPGDKVICIGQAPYTDNVTQPNLYKNVIVTVSHVSKEDCSTKVYVNLDTWTHSPIYWNIEQVFPATDVNIIKFKLLGEL